MKKYLTCDEITNQLDTFEVKSRIDRDLSLKYKGKKCTCPNPKHQDRNPSCIYNYDTKRFYCFTCCRSYSIFDHYKILYNCDINTAKDMIIIDFNLNNEPRKIIKEWETRQRIIKPKELNNYGSLNQYTINYFQRRGITAYSLDILQVRQYTDARIHIKSSDRVVFPIFDINKNHISNKYRNIKDKSISFDRNTDTKGLININNTNFNQTLYITEGETDLLTLLELFKSKKNTNIVSVPTGVSNLQWIDYNKDLLKQYPKIIICFDNDEVGKINQLETIKKIFLENINTNVYPLLWLGRKEKDINEVFLKDKGALEEMFIFTNNEITLKKGQNIDEILLFKKYR